MWFETLPCPPVRTTTFALTVVVQQGTQQHFQNPKIKATTFRQQANLLLLKTPLCLKYMNKLYKTIRGQLTRKSGSNVSWKSLQVSHNPVFPIESV
jgi:hypothetical protein